MFIQLMLDFQVISKELKMAHVVTYRTPGIISFYFLNYFYSLKAKCVNPVFSAKKRPGNLDEILHS